MLTTHPTLLIGPSDWQPEHMPREEFAHRLEALWQRFPAAAGAIVYGTTAHHAELAYLTNLVPKLEAAVALIDRSGNHRLLLGGGPNMLDAAKPLTFVTEMSPLRSRRMVGEAAAKTVGNQGEILVLGSDYMPYAFHRSLTEGLREAVLTDAAPALWHLMRSKSAPEIAAVREACRILGIAILSIGSSHRMGASVTTALLVGERAANLAGAQDVRTLFSVDGGQTLTPFTQLIDRRVDPLQVYVAIRRYNYWAEGFAVLPDHPSPAIEKASSLLTGVLGTIQPGTSTRSMQAAIEDTIKPYEVHPVTAGEFASAMGLALHEPPHTEAGESFQRDEVYSIRLGLTDRNDQHAIVSAMITINDDGSDVLWSQFKR